VQAYFFVCQNINYLVVAVMQLSNESTQEFKRLYKKSFGVDISDEEAREKGEALVGLFSIIYSPILKKDKESIVALFKTQ
jgi:hypothetical protein